jgi:predicted RNase H-like HicB family nuclease
MFGARTEIMENVHRFTAMIYRESDGFVSICPELDVASQGDTIEEASSNLREAVELFIETADPSEVEGRLSGSGEGDPQVTCWDHRPSRFTAA